MKYMITPGARLPVSAQTAGNECERLKSIGKLTPRGMVEESRAEDAPLHRCFEWNDRVAADKYRENQAQYIIRAVKVTVEESEEPTRAFVALVRDGKREYETIGTVLRDASSRQTLLRNARRELLSFKRKYQTLYELACVFEAIDGFIDAAELEA